MSGFDGDDPKGWERVLFFTFLTGGLIWVVPLCLLVWWLFP